jgi:hypothetical protein
MSGPVRAILVSLRRARHQLQSNKDDGHGHLMSNPTSITSVKPRNVPESDVAEIHIYIYKWRSYSELL